jgi:hypothetical protein
MLTALLAYWDEQPEWLERAVRSLEILGVTHLVACDGSYMDFAGGGAKGSDAEVAAINLGCEQARIKGIVFQPDDPWPTEMAKRSWMFAMSEKLGTDWHLVFDADYLVAEGFDLKPALDELDQDVGEILLRHHVLHGDALTNTMMPMPMLFRALPGLRVVGHHANYQTEDKCLWGEHGALRTRIEGVTVDHLSAFRDPARLEAQRAYYKRRDMLGLEKHPAPV